MFQGFPLVVTRGKEDKDEQVKVLLLRSVVRLLLSSSLGSLECKKACLGTIDRRGSLGTRLERVVCACVQLVTVVVVLGVFHRSVSICVFAVRKRNE